jgi:hypothetical protein
MSHTQNMASHYVTYIDLETQKIFYNPSTISQSTLETLLKLHILENESSFNLIIARTWPLNQSLNMAPEPEPEYGP